MILIIFAIALALLAIQGAYLQRQINEYEDRLRVILAYLNEKEDSNREFLEMCRKFREMMNNESDSKLQ